MAWLTVDSDGSEYIYSEKPRRYKNCWDMAYDEDGYPIGSMVLLPKGTIKKLIGKDLTWEDDPIELI